MVEDAREGKDFSLADRVADPGPDGRREIGWQLIKSPVRLDQQMQGSQLLEHPARPPGTGKLGRDGSHHASNSRGLSINQPRGHSVEVCIAGAFQAGDTTAYLVAQPLIQFVEPAGYPLGTRSGALGRCHRIG